MSDAEKKEILGQEKDLEMDELDTVAGGKECTCVLGGGGKASRGDKTCACVMGGGGEYTDQVASLTGKKCRCVCAVGGSGKETAPWELESQYCAGTGITID